MTQTITAMYDDQAQAQAAMSKLIAAGFQQSSIRLTAGATPTTTQVAGSYDHTRDEGGFWASLKEAFMPEEDRYTYSEGLSRGSTLLTATVDDSRVDAAMDILEEHGSVNLDEREATWRKEGWSGYGGGTTTSSTRRGMGAASTNLQGGAQAAGGIPVTGGAMASTCSITRDASPWLGSMLTLLTSTPSSAAAASTPRRKRTEKFARPLVLSGSMASSAI